MTHDEFVYNLNQANELYHHGVKGQKWGKKNGPPYPLDESEYSAEEKFLSRKKKIAVAGGIIGAATIAAGIYFVSKHRMTKMDNVIKAGKTIQHLGSEIDPNISGPFYASYLHRDNIKYLKNRETRWTLQHILRADTDIKIAGEKSALQAYAKTIGANNLSNKELKKSYKKFMTDMSATSSKFWSYDDDKLFRDFYTNLSAAGYSAVRDYNDQHMMRAWSPIILFNNFDQIKSVKVKQLL